MDRRSTQARAARYATYIEALIGVIGHADRARPLKDYCTGLMLACERKSVEVPDLIRDRCGNRS